MAIGKYIQRILGVNDSQILESRGKTSNIKRDQGEGTGRKFSAVKRKFGENYVSRSVKGLEAEGYQRIWIYDYTYKTLLGKSRRGMKIFSPENRLHSGVPPETALSPSLVILSL